MLYPTRLITETTPNHNYKIPNNSLYAFALTIGDDEAKNIVLMHTALDRQDFSIRAWVSRDVAGSEVVFIPHSVSFWHPNRSPHEIITIFDKNMTVPDVSAPLGLEPGDYFLNILNLSNAENSFSYFLDESIDDG